MFKFILIFFIIVFPKNFYDTDTSINKVDCVKYIIQNALPNEDFSISLKNNQCKKVQNKPLGLTDWIL